MSDLFPPDTLLFLRLLPYLLGYALLLGLLMGTVVGVYDAVWQARVQEANRFLARCIHQGILNGKQKGRS